MDLDKVPLAECEATSFDDPSDWFSLRGRSGSVESELTNWEAYENGGKIVGTHYRIIRHRETKVILAQLAGPPGSTYRWVRSRVDPLQEEFGW